MGPVGPGSWAHSFVGPCWGHSFVGPCWALYFIGWLSVKHSVIGFVFYRLVIRQHSVIGFVFIGWLSVSIQLSVLFFIGWLSVSIRLSVLGRLDVFGLFGKVSLGVSEEIFMDV